MEEKAGYAFFSNRKCEYYPCHPGADPERFNCLFCYCPLYALGERCGGRFGYTQDGIKDCSGCLLPHTPEGYGMILSRIPLLYGQMEEAKEARGTQFDGAKR